MRRTSEASSGTTPCWPTWEPSDATSPTATVRHTHWRPPSRWRSSGGLAPMTSSAAPCNWARCWRWLPMSVASRRRSTPSAACSSTSAASRRSATGWRSFWRRKGRTVAAGPRSAVPPVNCVWRWRGATSAPGPVRRCGWSRLRQPCAASCDSSCVGRGATRACRLMPLSACRRQRDWSRASRCSGVRPSATIWEPTTTARRPRRPWPRPDCPNGTGVVLAA